MTKSIKYFFSGLLLSFMFFGGINIFQTEFNSFLLAQISQPLDNVIPVAKAQEPIPPAPDINAQAAISVRIDNRGNEKIILRKNDETPLPIASLTKLMSALIVLENPEQFNFSKIVTISKAAANQGNTPNYGNLKEGEKYTLEKLLELTLVYSSNDAIYAISEVAGVDNFVGTMNQRAARLGMNYTYFINPNGLDPKVNNPEMKDMNYSTASDQVLLVEYILKNYPVIFEISSQAHNYDSIENGLSKVSLQPGQSLIGGKTGFTKNAAGCIIFVFYDERGNKFINVILGTPKEEDRIIEMQKIINWLYY
jgi:D-alanyl-D-alanine carboxypeptidase (penicillin-binding protein 5/6)